MEISLSKIAPCFLSLDIKIEKERVEETINRALVHFSKRVAVPGFRKGKAPITLVRRFIGEERLLEEVGRILAEESLQQAFEEKAIRPYGSPNVEIEKLEEGEEALIKATVYTEPVVVLPPYESIEIEYNEVKVKEEDVEQRLNMLRYRFAQAEPLKRKTVKRGDLVDVSIQVYIDGKPYGGEKKDKIVVGEEQLIPPIDVYLEEMKLGEEKEIEVHYPPDFNNPDLADKDAVLKVKVEGINKLVLPKLDDEFARQASQFNTLDELKESIRKDLEKEAKKVEEEQIEREILSRIISLSQVEFPEPMLEEETRESFKRFMDSIERQGYDLDGYLSEKKLTLEQVQLALEQEARDILIRRLILQEIGKREGLLVKEEEIEQRIEELAKANNVPKETIKRILEETGRMNRLIGDIYLDKVLEFLKKSVKIKKKEEN